MRPLFVRSAFAALGGVAFVVACSSSNNTAPPPPPADDAGPDAADTRPPTPAAWDRDVTRPDDATATQQRAACGYKRGQMPAETTGPATKIDDMPITNIVVLMQENRSFDSYFGHLNAYAGRTDIESAPADATNPDVHGGTTGANPWKHADKRCSADTGHAWHYAHLEWNQGKNDGFFEANNGHLDDGENAAVYADSGLLDGERAMWWYDQTDIPFYYDLAKTYAIADHYFSSVLGPTWPNRMYLYGANSYGITKNVFPDLTSFPYPDDGKEAVVFDELEKRHVDWNVYSDGSPGAAVILGVGLVTRYDRNPKKGIAEFLDQAKSGTLPPVAFVDAKLGATDGPDNDDEHPPANIEIGQHFVWSIVDALARSPQWAHTVLFLTYDENGGIYDHFPPPKACAPDTTAPQLEGPDVGTVGGFDQYGFRVPLVVVSPYAKKNFVSHAVYDHASITRFIEAKFKMPAISARDANADPFTDMFDWNNPPFTSAAPTTEPVVNSDVTQACIAAHPKG
jgi:phospholipase C